MVDESGSRKHRILVVDDNADNATLLVKLLELQGYVAACEVESTRTLGRLQEFNPDALLLDIAMPKISGYDLAKAIRKLPKFEKMLIVAITGHGGMERQQQSIETGIDYHLLKPVEFANLQQILAKHLR